MTTVTYFMNMRGDGDRWLHGYRDGDPIVEVASMKVETHEGALAAEQAFMFFQRVQPLHRLLDENEASSMSIGDVVRVQILDDQPMYTWRVCERFGFRQLTEDEVQAMYIVGRPVHKTVADVRQEVGL